MTAKEVEEIAKETGLSVSMVYFYFRKYGRALTVDELNNIDSRTEKNTARMLAEKTGKSRSWIYTLKSKLGRFPTVEEIQERKNGRPSKY